MCKLQFSSIKFITCLANTFNVCCWWTGSGKCSGKGIQIYAFNYISNIVSQALLQCKADINARDKDGKTAFDWYKAAIEDDRPDWFSGAFAQNTITVNDLTPMQRATNAPLVHLLLMDALE